MTPRTPLIIISLFGGMLIILMMMFTNQPSIAQNPTPTPDDLQRRATEIVAGATLTAQVGGDFTSVGTSTPLAGLCNSLTYRPMDDIEFLITQTLATIPLAPIQDGIEVLLLEETQDCVTFETRESMVSITVPTLGNEINDESLLGDKLAQIVNSLKTTSSPLHVLPNPMLTISFVLGNQTRQFTMTWQELLTLNTTGTALITQVTHLGIDAP